MGEGRRAGGRPGLSSMPIRETAHKLGTGNFGNTLYSSTVRKKSHHNKPIYEG